jgi:hypothetical protein
MLALVVLRVPSQRPTLLRQSRLRRRGPEILEHVDEVTDDAHVGPAGLCLRIDTVNLVLGAVDESDPSAPMLLSHDDVPRRRPLR